jgi:hypothetical protein
MDPDMDPDMDWDMDWGKIWAPLNPADVTERADREE